MDKATRVAELEAANEQWRERCAASTREAQMACACIKSLQSALFSLEAAVQCLTRVLMNDYSDVGGDGFHPPTDDEDERLL